MQELLFPNPVEVLPENGVADPFGHLFGPQASGSAIINGDVHKVLARMPGGIFQTCVTSPPYWSLRDYGAEGEIGAETTIAEYIESLVAVFDEVKRVLRDDGTLWLNIGDSFTSGGRTRRAPDKKNRGREMDRRPPTPTGLKPKDLIGVPWHLAFALQDAGWYLRTEVIWNKPNAQPESVGDRPTRSHEYVFLMSKCERYFYDVNAVLGPNGRRLRSVWDINTKATSGDTNFAVFPPALARTCVLSSTSAGDLIIDPFLGSGTTGMVATETGRRFVGVEIHPESVEIARRRISATIPR